MRTSFFYGERPLSFVLAFLIAVVFAGCGQRESENLGRAQKAQGPVKYGGVFRINEEESFRSLFPLNVTEVTAHRITNQIYEGLVKFNQKDLSVSPCLAEKWEVNEDATSFTFYLRKGVKFHDDPCFPDGKGREVTAKDFIYSFTRLCTASPDNQLFAITFKDRVVGANEYFASTGSGNPLPEGVKGLELIDDYTLRINLRYSFSGFLNVISHSGCWVFPKEAYDTYGVDMRIKCVGTGAFVLKTVKEGEAVILEKNPDYWQSDEYGNKLPYLDAVKFTFIKEKKSELLEFRKGNLDMVFRLPHEMINDVLDELDVAKGGGNVPFEMQVTPALGIFYFGFQHQSELFSNKRIRQAFNYAIDRESIVTYSLQGEGVAGLYGIVPPAFKNYTHDSIRGYSYEPEKARQLLAEAGYPNGDKFPVITLQTNPGGANNILVCEVVQKMLKENLNIEIKLEIMPMAQHYENLETGKALFWRAGWIADYPDPENFLNLLYGPHVPARLTDKSYVNSVRYQSQEYDSVFSKALREVNETERYRLYRVADQIAMDDAAIMPLYYYEFIRLLRKNVKNFHANSMEFRDLSTVFLEEKES